MKKLDLTGQRFGRLVAVRLLASDKRIRSRVWECRCDCGGTTRATGSALRLLRKQSCGCIHEFHGQRIVSEYKNWAAMRARCNNPGNVAYPRYGGRGIKVCARWEKFSNFLADMGPKPSPSHTIDRININKGYEPSNCRWATPSEQARNTSKAVWVKIDGKNLLLPDALKKLGMPVATYYSRRWRGWSFHRAVFTPVGASSKRKGTVNESL